MKCPKCGMLCRELLYEKVSGWIALTEADLRQANKKKQNKDEKRALKNALTSLKDIRQAVEGNIK
jgi:hypothetical protein